MRPPHVTTQRRDGVPRPLAVYAFAGQRLAGRAPAAQPTASNANSAAQGAAQRQRSAELHDTARELLAGPQGALDEALGASLAAVATDVQRSAGTTRAGILGSYAARMASARKQMQGASLAAVLQALQAERDAALQALSEQTARELKDRLAVARIMTRRVRVGGLGKS